MKSRDRANQSSNDQQQFRAAESLFLDDTGVDAVSSRTIGQIDVLEALEAFPRYVSKACLSKLLMRAEIFRTHVLPVHGDIIECGVLHGASLFLWAKLSAIFEPVNHTRRIVGFDTFEGFQAFHEKDSGTPFKPGDLRGLSLERMNAAIDVFDLNRPLSHIEKIHLVKGDLAQTAQEYVTANPHLIVAMLNLDVDLYEPTIAALKAFVPLMPRGGVVIFDEANYARFPGESLAIKEYLGTMRAWRLQRYPYTSMTSFAVLE